MAKDRDDDLDDRDDDRPRRRRDDDDDRPRRRRGDDDYDDGPRRNVPNYLVHAIIATLFCCLPLGIVAIIKAASVNSLVEQGKYRQAEKASADAKKFVNLSVILGLVAGIGWFLLNMFVFAAANK